MECTVELSSFGFEGSRFYYVYLGEKEYHVIGDSYTSVSERTPYWTNNSRRFVYALNAKRHSKVIAKIDAAIASAIDAGLSKDCCSVKVKI